MSPSTDDNVAVEPTASIFMTEVSYLIFYKLFNVIHQQKSKHDKTPMSTWNIWRSRQKSWAQSSQEQMPGNIAMCNIRWLVSSTVPHENENHVTNPCHVVIVQCDRMAGGDTFWQCTLFLAREKIPAADIRAWLQCIHRDVCTCPSSGRWQVKHFEDRKLDITDQHHGSCPRTVSKQRKNWAHQRKWVCDNQGNGNRD